MTVLLKSLIVFQELKILEDNIEQGILNEESKLTDADGQVISGTNGVLTKPRSDVGGPTTFSCST